jgi:hypothetical protein
MIFNVFLVVFALLIIIGTVILLRWRQTPDRRTGASLGLAVGFAVGGAIGLVLSMAAGTFVIILPVSLGIGCGLGFAVGSRFDIISP